MNTNNLYKLIESEFKIIEINNKRIILSETGKLDYPEITAKLTYSEDKDIYSLFSTEKDKDYFILSISNQVDALMALYIIAKKTLDEGEFNTHVQNAIRNATSENEIFLIFKNQFTVKNYSFFEHKTNSLNIEKNERGNYNVFYLDGNANKKYITEDRKMNIAYLVLYNYTCMLEEFYNLADNHLGINSNNNFFEDLKILYLF